MSRRSTLRDIMATGGLARQQTMDYATSVGQFLKRCIIYDQVGVYVKAATSHALEAEPENLKCLAQQTSIPNTTPWMTTAR